MRRSPTRRAPSRLFVWLLALSYIYLELTTDEKSMGVFIVPFLVGLQMIPVMYPGTERDDAVLGSAWFWVHISSLLVAYASFALAPGPRADVHAAVQGNQEEAPRLLLHAAPSLQILDAMNSRAVTVGWLFLTVGRRSWAYCGPLRRGSHA
jgi:ABC-type transport system involved in cytochrome c biogenesis permease subunit